MAKIKISELPVLPDNVSADSVNVVGVEIGGKNYQVPLSRFAEKAKSQSKPFILNIGFRSMSPLPRIDSMKYPGKYDMPFMIRLNSNENHGRDDLTAPLDGLFYLWRKTKEKSRTYVGDYKKQLASTFKPVMSPPPPKEYLSDKSIPVSFEAVHAGHGNPYAQYKFLLTQDVDMQLKSFEKGQCLEWFIMHNFLRQIKAGGIFDDRPTIPHWGGTRLPGCVVQQNRPDGSWKDEKLMAQLKGAKISQTFAISRGLNGTLHPFELYFRYEDNSQNSKNKYGFFSDFGLEEPNGVEGFRLHAKVL